MKLRRPDQSLDGDLGEQTGLPFGNTSLASAPCGDVIRKKPYDETSDGQIRLSAGDGLGHSLEAQIEPGAA